MRKKFKVTLIVFLVVVLGCFSQVFAETNQNNKVKKSVENSRNVKLFDNQTQIQPIHRYTFDNDNGNTVVDTGTMAGNDGKYNGSINGTNLITENGMTFMRFNGKGDYIEFKDQIIPIGKKTIAFKIRMKSERADRILLFANQKGTGTYGYGEQCEVTGGIVQWGIFKAVGGQPIFGIASNKNINDGKWHDVVMTWDGTVATNGAKMYIDDFSAPNAQATATAEETNNTTINLEIGNDYYGCYFEGDLSDFRVYSDVIVNSCETIALSKTTDTLRAGQTDILTATVTPDNAANKNVTWVSSDPNIASVDSTGKITAVKAGTATITATTTDGTNLNKSCLVTVNNPTTITLDKTTDSINVGDTDKVTPSVTPVGQDVTWISSDEEIVKVDQNGNIKGVSVGTAIITATTADGKKVSCTVTVKDQETGKSKLIIYMGNQVTREYYLTEDEIDNFINWYDARANDQTPKSYYVFKVPAQGALPARKDYVLFDKIKAFEVE